MMVAIQQWNWINIYIYIYIQHHPLNRRSKNQANTNSKIRKIGKTGSFRSMYLGETLKKSKAMIIIKSGL